MRAEGAATRTIIEPDSIPVGQFEGADASAIAQRRGTTMVPVARRPDGVILGDSFAIIDHAVAQARGNGAALAPLTPSKRRRWDEFGAACRHVCYASMTPARCPDATREQLLRLYSKFYFAGVPSEAEYQAIHKSLDRVFEKWTERFTVLWSQPEVRLHSSAGIDGGEFTTSGVLRFVGALL